ncbi:MAG: excinuclease ABC subunit C [Bacteroidales bacterium]|nr:excinuclease ABC subunit C [Bacteroidales bacterium]
MTPEERRHFLKNLPEKSGVYRYYNEEGQIIYVGKAKNLKRRVSSYFNKEQDSPKTRVLVSKIHDIRFTLTDSEYDALLLENNLIKKHQPRYNILLKDDKTYPWICVKNEAFPRIFSTRKRLNDGSRYFGPYSSVKTMNLLLEILRDLYPFRTCKLLLTQENIAKDKFRVCLDYHSKKCKAPCKGWQDEQEYLENIRQAVRIIEGDTRSVLKEMRGTMMRHAENWEFEKAQEMKLRIETLEHYQAKSTVVNPDIHDTDVFGYAEDGDAAYISYFKVMNGAIIQTQNMEVRKRLEESKEDVLLLAVVELRTRADDHTKEILLPFAVDTKLKDSRITVPKAGDKHQLLQLAQRNAAAFMQDVRNQRELLEGSRPSDRLMQQMQKDLLLPKEPAYIECFDNSNLLGQYAVGAMVCFRNGKPSKKDYRIFNIKTVHQADDFATMKEVLTRRYSRLLSEEKPLPDLILVDGGKGQISAALEALEALGIADKVSLLGLAERLEDIYRPHDPVPLYVDKKSETQRVLQHLRDEAHRFGITRYRKLHGKGLVQTELTVIQGIGKETADKLLRTFHSVNGVKKAELPELEKAIGPAKGKTVWQYFHAADNMAE